MYSVEDMSSIMLPVLLSLFCCVTLAQGSCTNPLQETLLSNDDMTYFPHSEVQILMLDVQFNCTGSISKLDGMFHVTGLGAHLIAFQIWRPTANNTYEQVSSQYIRDTELNDHPYIPNIQNFSIEPNMYFQRGDIIGFYIPSTDSVRDPISLVYTNGTSDGNEGRLYYINSAFSPCKVVMCEETQSILKGVQLQMRMELQQITNPTPSQSNQCVDVTQVETCPLPQTITTSTAIVSTTTTVSSTDISITPAVSTVSTPAVSTVSTPTTVSTQIPLPILIGVPVGLTILLIILTSILIIVLCCMKYGRASLRKKTEKVHSAILTHYSAEDGSLYTSPQRNRTSIIDEPDVVLPLPIPLHSEISTDIFSPGILPDTPQSNVFSPVIEPYASMISLPPMADSYISPQDTRQRSATISGPFDNFPSSCENLHTHGILPTVGEEPQPYSNPVSSMSNLSPHTRGDSRLLLNEDSRKPSHQSRTHGRSQSSLPSRFLRKTSQPITTHQSRSTDVHNGYPHSVPNNEPIRHQHNHVFERSTSLFTNNHSKHKRPVPPRQLDIGRSQSTAALLRNSDMAVASPYLEPSRLTKGNKSLSHDIIAQPYTVPIPPPIIPRKFSEQLHSGPSPYMRPSPTLPSRQTATNEAFQRNDEHVSNSRHKSESSVDSSATNFIYVPPEVISRNREPNAGQMTPLIANAGQMTPLIANDHFFVPSVAIREQLNLEHSPLQIYSKLDRSSESGDLDKNDSFWMPSTSTSELYDQLAYHKYREIPRGQIFISETNCLGSGHFGTVHKGVWEFTDGKLPVAVKTLRPDAPENERVKFLQEAATTGQFHHPNVIMLHGVVTLGHPLMIVLELLPKGDLKSYLKLQKTENENVNQSLLSRQFISFARQISSGMQHLSLKGYIHRDLAARNILLTDKLVCKIGDFGMARDLAMENFYESQTKQIPLRWTAPEAIAYRTYTIASDVWSYGMVLFEIYSVGRKPYHKNENKDIYTLARNGYCLPPPPGCSRKMYELMLHCWDLNPINRPKFSEIFEYLSIHEDILLHWSDDDLAISDVAHLLGAPIDETEHLYIDLQNFHKMKSQKLLLENV